MKRSYDLGALKPYRSAMSDIFLVFTFSGCLITLRQGTETVPSSRLYHMSETDDHYTKSYCPAVDLGSKRRQPVKTAGQKSGRRTMGLGEKLWLLNYGKFTGTPSETCD